MTPELQSKKQKLANQVKYNLHNDCDMEIRQAGPHWGLYCNNPQCKKKGKWIQWINQEHLQTVLELD